jgi:hypothetical protein
MPAAFVRIPENGDELLAANRRAFEHLPGHRLELLLRPDLLVDHFDRTDVGSRDHDRRKRFEVCPRRSEGRKRIPQIKIVRKWPRRVLS